MEHALLHFDIKANFTEVGHVYFHSKTREAKNIISALKLIHLSLKQQAGVLLVLMASLRTDYVGQIAQLKVWMCSYQGYKNISYRDMFSRAWTVPCFLRRSRRTILGRTMCISIHRQQRQ